MARAVDAITMNDEKYNATDQPIETIECPKEKNIHYFRQACENIIRPSGIRPWCKRCRHFTIDQETQLEE